MFYIVLKIYLNDLKKYILILFYLKVIVGNGYFSYEDLLLCYYGRKYLIGMEKLDYGGGKVMVY